MQEAVTVPDFFGLVPMFRVGTRNRENFNIVIPAQAGIHHEQSRRSVPHSGEPTVFFPPASQLLRGAWRLVRVSARKRTDLRLTWGGDADTVLRKGTITGTVGYTF